MGRPSTTVPIRRPAFPPRRLVSFFAGAMVVFWIASFLPGGGDTAWFAWGIVALVAVIGGRAAVSALECVALALGSAVGLAWGGLTQTGMEGGPSANEVISTALVIGIVVLIVAAVTSGFSAGTRALHQNVARARGQLGDATRR